MEGADKGKGRKFGVGKTAPPELRNQPKPSEELMPSSLTQAAKNSYVARPMFGKEKPKPQPQPQPKAAKAAKAANVKAVKPAVKPIIKEAVESTELADIFEREEEVSSSMKESEDAKEDAKEANRNDDDDESELETEPDDFKTMGKLILDSQKEHLYNTDVPTAYVPDTRRGFSEFIKSTYEPYELPNGPITIPKDDKYYPYQKFVRDYMRKESPYRGILVYHGLGSGKTCTAIAASEALFATAKKKIIVLTPFSLKKNFLKEVSFCGFRHFQLKNYWVSLDIKDPTAVLFANQIYGLSGKYIKSARNIWVPDFRKPQSESNFDSLPDEDRMEIRKQILAMVEWDPVKNPSGRIRFISYNGISAKKLMAMACDTSASKFFDDAVIVVDEIHNLIRLMQGKIEPYLSKGGLSGKKVRRTVPVEEITPNRWKPSLCTEGTKLYTRGYLFYRLLLDARNSKIIGLSGTPLINFPEELGILANVLHGYTTIIEGMIGESGKAVQESAEKVARDHPYIDYVSAKQDPKGGGTRVLISLLPQGVKKIENELGVIRIPEDDDIPTIQEVVDSIKKAYEDAEIPFLGELKAKAEELLPPFGDTFSNYFVSSQDVKRKAVLLTRLTGLISYYKGANLELMPRVKSDEIVRVPFSNYAQKIYSFKRTTEVKSELEKTSGKEIDKVWGMVYELGDSVSANNYKMGSRQACNFAFPPDVTRPTPTPKEREEEAKEGAAPQGIVELSPVEEEKTDEMELSDDTEDAATVADEDEEIERGLYETDEQVTVAPKVPKPDGKTRKANAPPTADIRFSNKIKNEYQVFDTFAPTPFTVTDGDTTETFPTIENYYQAMKFKTTDPEWYKQVRDAPTPAKAREMGSDKAHPAERDFMTKRLPYMKKALELKFKERKLRDLLVSTGNTKLIQGSAVNSFWGEGAEKKGENHLGKLLMELRSELKQEGGDPEAAECKGGTKPGEKYPDACKRARECLKTIAKSRMTLEGSEGLAEYSAKYAAMLEKIEAAPGSSLVYSQFLDMEGIGIFRIAMEVNGYAPIEIVNVGGSLAFSKATEISLKKQQPRYMTFSGGEDQEIRRTALDIFNAKLSELPESMTKILSEAGYKDNKVGEICRVFCITSAGAEGLSLRNVRAVHIMEPYWNEVRLRQVKGRAIRIGSHLDLDESQRDVSIYTYISCFSDEALTATKGDNKIDETLLLHDSVDSKQAAELGLPIKPGMSSYVMTTDEMIFAISERKRKIIESLECVMKSAAVDCELSYKQNRDTTFRCLPLKGKVGDFIYNPILEQDVYEASKFENDSVICAPREFLKVVNKVTYWMKEIAGPDKNVSGYDLYETVEQADPKNPGKKVFVKKVPENKVGTTGVRLVDGAPSPGPPVKLTQGAK